MSRHAAMIKTHYTQLHLRGEGPPYKFQKHDFEITVSPKGPSSGAFIWLGFRVMGSQLFSEAQIKNPMIKFKGRNCILIQLSYLTFHGFKPRKSENDLNKVVQAKTRFGYD